MHTRSLSLGLTTSVAFGLVLAANCSPTAGDPPQGGTGSTGNSGNDTGGRLVDGTGGQGFIPGDGGTEPTPGCGDGVLTDDEACDDGNLDSGDGCAGTCRALESGWSCPKPGESCIRIARCGDGVPVFPELCDDGGTEPGDGCSATCKVEVGYKCEGTPSDCTETVCGDGVQEGAESCEDDNTLPFDGCSAVCQAEPDCSAGACTSTCGDGLVLGEECDDGNANDGDGCSSTCKVEPGYTCTVPQPEGYMEVPAVFRDFRESHADFEPTCSAGPDTPTQGMVQAQLDADGKPVYSAVADSCVSSADTFAQWYRDVSGTNSTTVSTLRLWDTGTGSFVNRAGENGERFQDLDIVDCQCGTLEQPNTDENNDPIPCTACYYDAEPDVGGCQKQAGSTDSTPDETPCDPGGQCAGYTECVVTGNAYHGRVINVIGEWDGAPAFFPVDGDEFTPATERAVAHIPGAYGGWYEEVGEPLHNFGFTSEVRYWFQYDSSATYVLDFTGDDDVWVFINNQLVVDVGGIHTPVNASLTLAGNSAEVSYSGTEDGADPIPSQTHNLSLENGAVYEIAVFHAERHVTLSSFRLTLDGFATARSECTPICGDNIVALGEECDDGVNDGGYGECGEGCVLGAYCGDGHLDEGEQCDDGNNVDGDGCGSNCRNIVLY